MLAWGIGFHLAALADRELEHYVDQTGLEPPTSVSRMPGLQVTAGNIFPFGRDVRGTKRKTRLFFLISKSCLEIGMVSSC